MNLNMRWRTGHWLPQQNPWPKRLNRSAMHQKQKNPSRHTENSAKEAAHTSTSLTLRHASCAERTAKDVSAPRSTRLPQHTGLTTIARATHGNMHGLFRMTLMVSSTVSEARNRCLQSSTPCSRKRAEPPHPVLLHYGRTALEDC